MFNLVGYGTLTLYIMVFIFSLSTAYTVFKNTKDKTYKNIMYSLISLSIFSSLFYSIAQLFWIINNHEAKITDYESLLWAVSEWTLGITLLSYILALRVFVNWQCGRNCKNISK
jgi:hypothetical protein